MSLYKDYLEETTDIKIMEREYGFATYSISGDECWIRDIFVQKDLRQTSFASKLADKISDEARSKGCKFLTGTVVLSNKTPELSLKVLMGYGMKLHSANNNIIVFKKGL